MAITVKIVDGDFVVDDLGQLSLLSGKSLLVQHINNEGINSIPRELPVDGVINDLLEGFLSLRLKSRLDILKKNLLLSNVNRAGEEAIDRVDIVLAKRVPTDPRTIKFWVRVISGAGETTDIVSEA